MTYLSEKGYQAAISMGTSDGVLVVDEGGVIVDCNKIAETLLDAVPGELLGTEYAWIFSDNDRRASSGLIPLLQTQNKNQEETHHENLLKTAIGRMFTCEIRTLPPATTGLQYTIILFRDISDKVSAKHIIERWDQASNDILRKTVQLLGQTVAQRDPYTANHQARVAELAIKIGEELGLDESTLIGLQLGALIHDVGKIHIPGEILTRPGRLSKEEFSLIKTHAAIGHGIVQIIDFPWPVADIALQHHERLDGSGYPQGLKSNEINQLSKIVSVADVVESMTSHRPYRIGHGIERALDELRANSGTAYDPDAVEACEMLFTSKDFVWTTQAGEIPPNLAV